jgi:cytochrome b561
LSLLGSHSRHGSVAQFFHWMTVVLVGAAYLLGPGGSENRVYSANRTSILSWHETLGLLVLVVLILRLAWRLIDRAPEEPSMPLWMLYASKVVHWLLYALLVAVPLTAIMGAWYEAHPVTFLAIGSIGPLVSESHELGQTITDLHRTLGSFIVWVAGAHAAAALFHHFVLGDSVLLSMLPRFGSRVSGR